MAEDGFALESHHQGCRLLKLYIYFPLVSSLHLNILHTLQFTPIDQPASSIDHKG